MPTATILYTDIAASNLHRNDRDAAAQPPT